MDNSLGPAPTAAARLFGRAPGHGLALAERLLRLDPSAFRFAGLPIPTTPITDAMQQMARPVVERAALTLAVGEAWAMLAAISAVGVLVSMSLIARRTPA